MTVRVLEVIDGLVTAFTAVDLDGPVSKGWQILPVGDPEHIFVAGRGAEFGGEDVATSTIEWPGLSPLSRTETGTVDCAVSVWTGDHAAVGTATTRAYAILNACEATLRANPSLSSAIALQVKITETALRMSQEGEGFLVVLPFTVTFQTSE